MDDDAERRTTRREDRVSRSELYAKALAAMVEKHSEELATSQLNDVYGPDEEASSLEPDIADLQRRSLPQEKW
jgi:hypothetical protein